MFTSTHAQLNISGELNKAIEVIWTNLSTIDSEQDSSLKKDFASPEQSRIQKT